MNLASRDEKKKRGVRGFSVAVLAVKMAHWLNEGAAAAIDWLEWAETVAVAVSGRFDRVVDFDPVGYDYGAYQLLDRYSTVLSFCCEQFEVLVAEGEHEFCHRIAYMKGKLVKAGYFI